MSVIFQDSAQLYTSGDDLFSRWTRPGYAGYTPRIGALGRDGAPSIDVASSGGRGMVYQKFDSKSAIGIHVSFRYSGDEEVVGTNGNGIVVAGSSQRLVYLDNRTHTTSQTNYASVCDLLTISVNDLQYLVVENCIMNAGSTVSRLVLDTASPKLVAGQLYSLEALVDFTGSDARIAVWLDGQKITDSSFTHDRVAGFNGVATNLIDYVALCGQGASTYSSGQPGFSDIVIYDASNVTAPVGPLSVSHFSLDDPALALPVDDASRLTIPTAGIDLGMPASTPTSGAIIGAFLEARTMASELEYFYSTRFTVTVDGSSTTFIADNLTGSKPTMLSYKIEGIDDFADLQNLNVRAVSLE